MAKLDQINIVVGDMEAMADFYRRLGVELPAGPPEWAPHHRNAEAGDGVDHRSNWAGIVSDARTIPAQMPIWDESRPDGGHAGEDYAATRFGHVRRETATRCIQPTRSHPR